ncbi:hypothetical protein [Rhodanobacter sp. B05]|uniref:hypothetical protein n=1 Tax=Rhodanobacter sp. B05 TaxID=1945859 RepID=UPI001115A264|nr:hypothetical protein [Rhodanobacter sp. B05]
MTPGILPTLPVLTFLQQRTRIFAVRPLHCQHLMREAFTQPLSNTHTLRRRNDRRDVTATSMPRASKRLLPFACPDGRRARVPQDAIGAGYSARWRSAPHKNG